MAPKPVIGRIGAEALLALVGRKCGAHRTSKYDVKRAIAKRRAVANSEA